MRILVADAVCMLPHAFVACWRRNAYGRYLRGMQGFVSQALGMWRDGMTLSKLTALQGVVNEVRCVYACARLCVITYQVQEALR